MHKMPTRMHASTQRDTCTYALTHAISHTTRGAAAQTAPAWATLGLPWRLVRWSEADDHLVTDHHEGFWAHTPVPDPGPPPTPPTPRHRPCTRPRQVPPSFCPRRWRDCFSGRSSRSCGDSGTSLAPAPAPGACASRCLLRPGPGSALAASVTQMDGLEGADLECAERSSRRS